MDTYGEEVWLPVEALMRALDYTPSETEYQRLIVPGRAEMIGAAFQRIAFARPQVNQRPGGYYAVLDGAHRIEGAYLAGEKMVPVILYEGLTLAEEARVFLRINLERARASVVVEFHAECVAAMAEGQTTAEGPLALDALLVQHGLDARGLSRDQTVPFGALGPIKAAVAFGNLGLVDLSLTAMKAAFTPPAKRPWFGNTRIISGVTEFFWTTKVTPRPTQEEFTTIIREEFVTPDALAQAADLHATRTHKQGTLRGGGNKHRGRTTRRESDPVVTLLLKHLRTLRRDLNGNGAK